MTTANTTTVSAVSPATETTAPAAETTATAPTVTVQPEPCVLCGLIGKHELPAEPATCVLCGKTHGTTVRREVPRGNKGKMVLVDRNVAVRHSLLALRAGGLKEDGAHFVNPAAPWEAQPVCDDCAYEMVRAVKAARKAAYDDGAERADVLDRFPYPRICAFSLVAKWVDDENTKEAAQRERQTQKRAENEAARAEDKKRRELIAKLVAKGARPHRSGSERRGSVPFVPVADRTAKNGGKRNDRGQAQAYKGDTRGVAEAEGASEAEVQEQLDAQAKGRKGALPLARPTARA